MKREAVDSREGILKLRDQQKCGTEKQQACIVSKGSKTWGTYCSIGLEVVRELMREEGDKFMKYLQD